MVRFDGNSNEMWFVCIVKDLRRNLDTDDSRHFAGNVQIVNALRNEWLCIGEVEHNLCCVYHLHNLEWGHRAARRWVCHAVLLRGTSD